MYDSYVLPPLSSTPLPSPLSRRYDRLCTETNVVIKEELDPTLRHNAHRNFLRHCDAGGQQGLVQEISKRATKLSPIPQSWVEELYTAFADIVRRERGGGRREEDERGRSFNNLPRCEWMNE